MVDYCKSQGFDIFTITREKTDDDVKQYEIGVGIPFLKRSNNPFFKNTFSPFLISKIRKILNFEKPDVIHAFYVTSNGFLAALTDYHPLVVSILGSDIFINAKSMILKPLVKYALNKADCICCAFPHVLAEPVFNELGTDISKVSSILFGVDTEKFRPMQFDSDVATQFNVSSNEPIVVYTRGFEPVYDCATFFSAIPLVLKEKKNTRFIALHKPGQQSLGMNIARELGIENAVVFHEWIPHDEIPRLLSLASIYVSTSLSDGASNSLLEAMACGIAPVVSDIPANRPWISDGVNGYLFTVKDEKALAQRILTMLEDEKLRNDFGKQSRDIVETHADQQKEIKKYKDLYLSLLEK